MEKKLLIISYGIKEFDGRLKEIIRSCENVIQPYVICLTKEEGVKEKNFKYIYVKNRKYLGMSLYLEFFIKSIIKFLTLKKSKNNMIIFIDNFYAAPIGLMLKFLFPNTVVIQDCRELYFIENMPGLGKLFCFFEEKLMKKSDLVFCANKYRSQIMKDKFDLKFYPKIFDNVRFLDGNYDKKFLDEKYKEFFQYRWNIVSTGGYTLGRKTDILINDIQMMKGIDVGLYIVGSGSSEDKTKLNKIIATKGIKNVHFIEKVPMDELRYIVQKCQIGVVSYNQKDLNNEYCSSGKIYEYIGEGLPVVTTENIPLVEFCKLYEVGVANNHFNKSIEEVINNYAYYKQKTIKLMESMSIENSNSLTESIRKVCN